MALITKTNDNRKLLKSTLENYQNANLNSNEILPVEFPRSLDNYTLKHPIGAYLIFFQNAAYKKSEAANEIYQEKDSNFAVVVVARSFEDAKTVEDYLDVAEAAITGLPVSVNRADKQVYPVSSEFIKEDNGEWWYKINFVVPEVNEERADINP